jgi:hypothetical protein
MKILRHLLLIIALFAPLPAFAEGALVKSEAQVDVTGKDAADAKTQAMAKGQIDALIELLAKLTPPGQAQDIVDTLDGKKIAALVHGTEVDGERISSNRYRARLIVSFDADEISALIGKFNTGIAKQEVVLTTGSFMIIPPFEDDNGAALWDDANPWLKIWRTVGLEVTSGDIIVPYGDGKDASIIDAKSAASATYNSLAPMALRYGVSDAVIVSAKYSATPDMSITVTKRRLNRTRNEINTQVYRADPQETRDALLARAARDIIYNLQNKKTEELSSAQGVRGGERAKIMALASLTNLSSWTQIRTKLSGLPMIDKLELVALSPQQVDMVIHYRGSEESLANGIAAQKLRLLKNKAFWVISNE